MDVVFGSGRIPLCQAVTGNREFIAAIGSVELGNICFRRAPAHAPVFTDPGNTSIGKLQKHSCVREGIVIIILAIGTVYIRSGTSCITQSHDLFGIYTGHCA